MKTLPLRKPTSEQLPIIQDTRPGVSVIRGAAGSGKTTTALLRLRQLASFWLSRRKRLGRSASVRMLVLAFNRTLRGYVADLAEQQIKDRTNLDLSVTTFGKWAMGLLADPAVLEGRDRVVALASSCAKLPLDDEFLRDEVDYVLGRFLPADLGAYLSCRREGRGTSPRVNRDMRARILNEIVRPYSSWKARRGVADWNDLALGVLDMRDPPQYDVIVIDEAQDFSANQARSLMYCSAKSSVVTFVLDAAQRIYPRGFTWTEAGIKVLPSNSHQLKKNHRNTAEICRFAEPLLQDMDIGDDGTFPDFRSCERHGAPPIVLKGRYAGQIRYAMEYIMKQTNLANESVAFLKPRGGRWFDTIKQELARKSLAYVDLTRRAEWPRTGSNVGLSTMHSAKGLEFDHVIILGLNEEVTPHGSDPNDTELDNWRRILAMAVTRARESVILGYKSSEASSLIGYLDPATYQEIDV